MGHGGAMDKRTAFVQPSGEHLVDDEGAASYLGTTPRHVRKLWAERRLAGVKVGRLVRFRRQDLDAFVDAHRVDAVR